MSTKPGQQVFATKTSFSRARTVVMALTQSFAKPIALFHVPNPSLSSVAFATALYLGIRRSSCSGREYVPDTDLPALPAKTGSIWDL